MSNYGETYRHIAGNVIGDPKVFQTTKGEITKFTVAEQDGFGDAPSRFYSIAVWNEGLQQFVRSEIYKGAKVAVEGDFKTEVYNDRETLSIFASKIGIVQYATRTRKGEKPAESVSSSNAAALEF